ncbi:MAG: DUF4340 domain-containing protein [Kiritimatiellia bacterium]
MSFRLTGLLALVAAALALLIAFADRDDDVVRARLEQTRRAFRFDPARVDGLILETDGQTIECRHDGRRWRLVRPLAARADPIAIARLLGALQELPRGDVLLPPRRSGNPYAPYGLDAPRATISIVAGAATNRILIGRRTPLGDGVYVRQSDQTGLVRLDPALLDLLPAGADALRDRALLGGAPAAIDRLDVRGPAGYLQLARAEHNGWRMYQPFAARADSATVAALVEKLLACSVVQFVQDGVGDLAPYGLDSQSAVAAVLNTDAGDGSQVLVLGDPLPNDPALVYARLQAENSIYAVPRDVRQALLVAPEDLRDRRLPGLDPDKLGGLRIEAGETVLDFRQDDAGAWRIAAPIRAPADADAVRALLRSWADVRLVAFEDADPAAPPAAGSREIRLTPRQARAPGVVLRVAPQPDDANACRIAIEGEASVAVAAPARLLDFPLDPQPYRARDVLELAPADVDRIRIAAGETTVQIDRDPSTGQWVPAAPWLDGLLAALAPLRAESILPAAAELPPAAFDPPHLVLTVRLRGASGIAATLTIGAETEPGGARLATLRGRDFVFTLPAWTVAALAPPETP